MQIFINNRRAALKEGTSFEYVSENHLLSGSDCYTLTITFPLGDCPENLAIFGHINRNDVAAQKLVFDCEIRDGQFVKSGCITIQREQQQSWPHCLPGRPAAEGYLQVPARRGHHAPRRPRRLPHSRQAIPLRKVNRYIHRSGYVPPR